MDVGEGEDVGDGEAGAEEQDMGIQEAKYQPEHIGEEKDIVDNSSTLPFRSLQTRFSDRAKAPLRVPPALRAPASFMRSDGELLVAEEKRRSSSWRRT